MAGGPSSCFLAHAWLPVPEYSNPRNSLSKGLPKVLKFHLEVCHQRRTTFSVGHKSCLAMELGFDFSGWQDTDGCGTGPSGGRAGTSTVG